MPANFIILGCGFTGRRVARRLLLRGAAPLILTRDPAKFADLALRGAKAFHWDLDDENKTVDSEALPALAKYSSAVVLHSVPDIPDGQRARFRNFLAGLRPSRVVYLSTTGIYGDQFEINADTIAQPNNEKSRRRVEEETFVRNGEWSSLILRPAAIYGPGRGAHVHQHASVRYENSKIVSRIHVDDLAALAESGMLSKIGGSYPVADDLPCSSSEVNRFGCLLRGETPEPNAVGTPSSSIAVAGRRVDGTKIRELLGVALRYETYKQGVIACVAEETANE